MDLEVKTKPRVETTGDALQPITWTNEKRRLGELAMWERNPRQIRKDEAKRLLESLDQFGQIHPIAITPDNVIIDGHQREKVWLDADRYGPDYEVDVRVASRQLTEKEREKLTVFLHKGTTGEWNFDVLSEWDLTGPEGGLLDWGFTRDELGLDFDELPSLDDLEEEYGEGDERDFWPVVRVQVAPETHDKYLALMATMPGADEAEKFDALISRSELS